jgi:hypothetical protein
MSLLTVIQKVCARVGIGIPTYIISNPDPKVGQMAALIEEALDEIIVRFEWPVLTQEVVFTSIAAEDQGNINTIAPNGFKYIVKDTIFNRTLRRPFYGPITASRWQSLKALPNPGPFYKYRIVRDHLMMNPPMVAGHTCAFEYISKWAVTDSTGTSYKEVPTVDSDVFLLDEKYIIACLKWKWKYEKGLEYSEDKLAFEVMINDLAAKDGSQPILSMDGPPNEWKPGVFVPSGNWNIP